MKTLILETTRQIEAEKRANNRVPRYALLSEICQRLQVSKTVLLPELKKMQTAGAVFGTGDTINDNYILLQPLENYMK